MRLWGDRLLIFTMVHVHDYFIAWEYHVCMYTCIYLIGVLLTTELERVDMYTHVYMYNYYYFYVR